MRHALLQAWAAIALLVTATPVLAVSPVPVVMGPSRDGPMHDLQRKVDRLIGPGRINVERDFVGARLGDPDPWYWINPGQPLEATLVDRKSPHGVIGWYHDDGNPPVVDGILDGVVFDDWRRRGARTLVRIPASVGRFGFYVVRQGGYGEEGLDDGTFQYFTNRTWNDCGPHGLGALHSPFDGDVQMLVFDISRWAGGDTWLVACEYSDSGCHVGLQRDESDNDYSDLIFTISGVGTTPTQGKTFGQLKRMFR